MGEAGPGEMTFVPDMPRRQTMNAILLGAVGVSTLGLAVPYLSFFVPTGSGGGSGVLVAKASHISSARELVQGLNGDATYLILDEDKNLAYFGLNAVCTQLGCVVPWNKAENKYMCPCNG